jgi:hypothetical protein
MRTKPGLVIITCGIFADSKQQTRLTLCCHDLLRLLVAMSKSTSTLLDGNHVFPPFYACYLLRSKATPNSNRTYVGACAVHAH